MTTSTAFTGKTLMITGGTGSFGNTVLKHFVHPGNSYLLPRREETG